jgi:hypothetical protein
MNVEKRVIKGSRCGCHTEGVARCLKAILRGNLDARNSRFCFPTLNNIEKSKKMN